MLNKTVLIATASVFIASVITLSSCADVGPFRVGDEELSESGADANTNTEPPSAIQLASSEGAPRTITVNDRYLYWTETFSNSIGRIAKDGTGTTEQMTSPSAPTVIEAQGTGAYWLTESEALYGTTDDSFGTPAGPLVARISAPLYLAVASDFIYYTSFWIDEDASQGSFNRVSRAGGAPQTVHAQELGPVGVAVSDTSVFWSSFGAVHQAPLLAPSSKQTIALDQGLVEELSVTQNRACWMSRAQAGATAYDIRCLADGNVQNMATQQELLRDIEITEEYLYWAVGGTVMRTAFSSGETQAVHTSSNSILDLAVDSTNLYWVERVSPETPTGSIWSIRHH